MDAERTIMHERPRDVSTRAVDSTRGSSTSPGDGRASDLHQAVVKLRNDLRFTPQTGGGRPYYVVEDPVRSKFYRIGVPEYTFISLLDGKTTIGDAIRLTAAALADDGFGDTDAAGICRWLVDANLAHTAESSKPGRLIEAATAARRRRGWQWFNPIVFRLPLLYPDALFRRITPWLAWIYSRPAVLAWCTLVGIAGYEISANWSRFVVSSQQVFTPGNWLWLALCWLGLKLLHETSHGAVCKKYNGAVREMGVLLILFAPIAYVDVTSSWRFRSKWQRIFTATAGMYTELAIAAAAVLLWSHTDRGPLNQLCFNIATMASVTTVLFNANPLMRFDGYYILSDLLGIQNLYTSGQQYLRYWCRRYLLGVKTSLPNWSRAAGAIIRVYGMAAFCWRIVVCAGLLLAAATLFHGAGIVLAVLAAILWLGLPLFRLATYLLRKHPGAQPNRIRFALVTATGTALAAALLMTVPWPGAAWAPAFVEYAPPVLIRANSEGFVRDVMVRGGQFVEEGEVLAVLDNDELKAQLADLELRIEQSKIKSRQHQKKQEMAAFQAETAAREALEKQRDEVRIQVEQLTVRAPESGNVIGRRLEAMRGVYLEEGDKLLEIGNDEQKEIRVSIAQDDLNRFQGRVGKPIDVSLPGHDTLACTLTKISPRATLEPEHIALCAPLGGPLTVCRKEVSDDASSNTHYEFLAPRFTGFVQLEGPQSERLHAGQTGTVSFGGCNEAIGPHLYHLLTRWVQRRLQRSG